LHSKTTPATHIIHFGGPLPGPSTIIIISVIVGTEQCIFLLFLDQPLALAIINTHHGVQTELNLGERCRRMWGADCFTKLLKQIKWKEKN